MCNMPSYAEQSDKLAGQISLLKSFCTRNAGKIADKAVQSVVSSLAKLRKEESSVGAE